MHEYSLSGGLKENENARGLLHLLGRVGLALGIHGDGLDALLGHGAILEAVEAACRESN